MIVVALSHLVAAARPATLEYQSVVPFDYDGTVTWGAVLGFEPGSIQFWSTQQNRLALRLASDVINEKGGLHIGSLRYAVRLLWVDAGKTNETLIEATRFLANRTDYVFSIHTSGYTKYVSSEAGALGKLTIAGGAATTSVITQNNLTFGFLPPADVFATEALRGVKKAAEATDSSMQSENRIRSVGALPRNCGSDSTTCFSSLVFGAIFDKTNMFNEVACTAAADEARQLKLRVAEDGDGALVVGVAEPDVETLKTHATSHVCCAHALYRSATS